MLHSGYVKAGMLGRFGLMFLRKMIVFKKYFHVKVNKRNQDLIGTIFPVLSTSESLKKKTSCLDVLLAYRFNVMMISHNLNISYQAAWQNLEIVSKIMIIKNIIRNVDILLFTKMFSPII